MLFCDVEDVMLVIGRCHVRFINTFCYVYIFSIYDTDFRCTLAATSALLSWVRPERDDHADNVYALYSSNVFNI